MGVELYRTLVALEPKEDCLGKAEEKRAKDDRLGAKVDPKI